MMYCRPYLYVRCTWSDLSCAHARMHITHARLRCAGQALMIEGREKGRKGSDSGIFRPTNLRCLFSGLYNWIQNGGYPLYLAVGRHFNFSCFEAPFSGSFLSHVSTRVFFFEIYGLCLIVYVNWIHIDGLIRILEYTFCFEAVVSSFPVLK